jgi:hypothetical protein
VAAASAAHAEHGFDSPAGEAFAEWRDNSGAGDNPVVLQLLAVVGPNPDVADPATAKARVNAIMADKGHAYWKGNRRAVYKVRLLHQLASPRISK